MVRTNKRTKTKTLDKIIDLFCVVGDSISPDNSVYGMDTELFKTRQEAQIALLKILEEESFKCPDNSMVCNQPYACDACPYNEEIKEK